jgi:hypothetical protein
LEARFAVPFLGEAPVAPVNGDGSNAPRIRDKYPNVRVYANDIVKRKDNIDGLGANRDKTTLKPKSDLARKHDEMNSKLVEWLKKL